MKKRLLSFWIVLCMLIPLVPASLAGSSDSASGPKIEVTNQQFTDTETDNTASFQVNLSGADVQNGGAVFVTVYAESRQMTQIKSYPPAATITVELSGMARKDRIKVFWLDARSMPLAQCEVYRVETYNTNIQPGGDGPYEVAFAQFSAALSSMIENYQNKNAAQFFTEYKFGRLIIHSNEKLPDLNGYHVTRSLSDMDGYTILQFDNPADAEACAEYLKPYLEEEGEFIEPDRELSLSPENTTAAQDDSAAAATANSWGVSVIKADEYAKDLLNRGKNRDIVVAVVDSGVDSNHEFFTERNPGRMVPGWDFVAGNSTPVGTNSDKHSHGTHVAGTIVDCTPGLTGIKIMPVRVLDANGRGFTSAVALGIKYAANQGAKVINLSLGGGHDKDKDDAINYAVNRGCVVVVAAGNDNVDTKYYCPSHMEKAIVVSAIAQNLIPAKYSNHGSSVDLAAPGSNIKSTVPKSINFTGYENKDGTSMAAPHVSACAAMLLDDYASLTPADVETKLKDAVSVPTDWSTNYGKGIVNMQKFIGGGGGNSGGSYAVVYTYGSGVELVFQKTNTHLSGRTFQAEYFIPSADSLSSVSSTEVDGGASLSADDTTASDGSNIDEVFQAQWHTYRNQILKVTFQDPLQPKSTATWFAGCEKLTAISGLDKLDTSRVTDMSKMFDRCSSLTTLDLKALKTNSVTNMKQMFNNCSALATLDLTDWDTGKVTNMEDMFSGCTKLTEISGLGKLDTSRVTDMSRMFDGCTSLTTLDLGKLKTGSVTNMKQMFNNCSALATLDLSGWDTGKVTKMEGMFNGCAKLTAIYASDTFTTSKVTDSGNDMFKGCTALTGDNGTRHNSSFVNKTYARMDAGTSTPGYFSRAVFYVFVCNDNELVFQYSKNAPSGKIAGSSYRVNCISESGAQSVQWQQHYKTITTVTFRDKIKPVSTATWFFRFTQLKTIQNLSNLDTSNVTDMSQMFANSGLTSLDLRTFNTGKVTSMKQMFNNCSALQTLNVSNWNTGSVTNMADMFNGCSVLQTLDLSGWNTRNVTQMAGMFNNCKKLTTIRVSESDTFSVSKVTDGNSAMFDGCTSLKGGAGTAYSSSHTKKDYARRDGGTSAPGYFSPGKIIQPIINRPDKPSETLYVVLYTDGELAFQENLNAQPGKTIKKTYKTDSAGYFTGDARGNYPEWHDNAASIKSVNFTTVIAPTSTAEWFEDCQNLTTIKNSAYLFTDFVTNMMNMFADCKNLTTLDLSNFNTAQVTEMYQMFYRCEKLTTIYVSASFVTGSVSTTDSLQMFDECESLRGGRGTTYSSSYTDKTYARIDGGTSSPGYFTSK